MILKYPYYADNSSYSLSVIVTIHGTSEYRINCKKFPDGYYVKGKDLEYVGEDWVKKENRIFDHETQTFVPNTKGLTNGIVGVNDKGVETIGYFSPNPYKNCYVKSAASIKSCISYEILLPEFYIERLSEGVFYRKAGLTDNNLVAMARKELLINNAGSPYNLSDSNSIFLRASNLYNKNVIPLDKDIKYVSSYLKEISFGIELETINGTLPEYLRNQYGIIICKDGSLRGKDGSYPPEYVTIPLSGAKGLQTIRNISREIAKRSDIDIKCSYHVHLGGFKIDRLLMVSLFNLCTKIQNDIFKMFPHYKVDEVKYAEKEKNYCKKLPRIMNHYKDGDFNNYINKSYEDIYGFLTGGHKFDKKHNVRAKVNPWGNQKWEILSRYYWVNFVNPIFGKQDTIEFRLHTPTLNADKIINWLLMCVAIIRFAQNNTKRCIQTGTIPFTDILEIFRNMRNTQYAGMLSQNLINYYTNRVQYFAEQTTKCNYICLEEFVNDTDFKFNTIDIS